MQNPMGKLLEELLMERRRKCPGRLSLSLVLLNPMGKRLGELPKERSPRLKTRLLPIT